MTVTDTGTRHARRVAVTPLLCFLLVSGTLECSRMIRDYNIVTNAA